MTELKKEFVSACEGFTGGDWQHNVDLRDFIQKNYTPYEGDESFLPVLPKRQTSFGPK